MFLIMLVRLGFFTLDQIVPCTNRSCQVDFGVKNFGRKSLYTNIIKRQSGWGVYYYYFVSKKPITNT